MSARDAAAERTDDVRVALGVAAGWFREYEKIHMDKCREEEREGRMGFSLASANKAARNRERAEYLEAALRTPTPVAQPERLVVEALGRIVLAATHAADLQGLERLSQDATLVRAALRTAMPVNQKAGDTVPDNNWHGAAPAEPKEAVEGGWRGMESAPRDGTPILGYWPSESNAWPIGPARFRVRDVNWEDDMGICGAPVCWRPMPPLPSPPSDRTGDL